ncbi:MAG: hypothetical protein JSS44_13020 [Proteobacteria bacterium]|nr:hypothetical protein [Pseudomonadota bacterium]
MGRRWASVLLLLSLSVPAWAGVPLKGIGVSLGKIPGGGCAAKTTDAMGHVDFGIWPTLPKGAVYTVRIEHAPTDVNVTIKGASGGPISRTVAHGNANERMAAQTIRLVSDGKTPLVVEVEAASTTLPVKAAEPHSIQ